MSRIASRPDWETLFRLAVRWFHAADPGSPVASRLEEAWHAWHEAVPGRVAAFEDVTGCLDSVAHRLRITRLVDDDGTRMNVYRTGRYACCVWDHATAASDLCGVILVVSMPGTVHEDALVIDVHQTGLAATITDVCRDDEAMWITPGVLRFAADVMLTRLLERGLELGGSKNDLVNTAYVLDVLRRRFDSEEDS
jgi:hypothetical protein